MSLCSTPARLREREGGREGGICRTRRKEKRKSGSSVQRCFLLLAVNGRAYPTQGKEKKWGALCSAVSCLLAVNGRAYPTQGEEKKWELCAALFLAY